ncbi:MAG: site-specific integrase [Paludibacteraceae bacterium]
MKNHKKQLQSEPIKLRTKQLSNGSQSLYLDYYRKGRRAYEFLGLYLLPENTPYDRQHNNNALQTAHILRACKTIEWSIMQLGSRLLTPPDNLLLTDWLNTLIENDLSKHKKTDRQYKYLSKLLVQYQGDRTRLCDIDKNFCSGFLEFLQQVPNSKTRRRQPLAEVTRKNYYRRFNCALNTAVRKGLLTVNPFTQIDSDDKPKDHEKPKTYLTIDELRTLAITPCATPEIKNAFLFSCFCGLRISDIKALKWKHIVKNGNKTSLELIMQKTQMPIYIKLSDAAQQWLPAHGDNNEAVFRLPAAPTINRHLKRWTETAHIDKKVTFHTARHTFATTLLTLGADIYTTSKLLGHTDIKTTQIYAKIVDKKKDAAIDLFNKILK